MFLFMLLLSYLQVHPIYIAPASLATEDFGIECIGLMGFIPEGEDILIPLLTRTKISFPRSKILIFQAQHSLWLVVGAGGRVMKSRTWTQRMDNFFENVGLNISCCVDHLQFQH
jgi:hypothetical protein